MSDYINEIKKRRTFAIISHPDAGKTTLTEKFLLYGGAIRLAGSVKARKASKHAVSDWMEIEKQRGISVTSSVLQFNYGGRGDRIDAAFGLPIDYSGGWVHAVMVIDREALEVRCAFDFGDFNTVKIPEKFRDDDFGVMEHCYFGQDSTLKYAPLTAVLDDFVLVDGLLTEEDVANMKDFYGV